MNKFYLLLLCCIVLFKANSQPGCLDSSFGKNGVQTTTFFNNPHLLYQAGRVVLTSARGDIFLVMLASNGTTTITTIARYLPDGRLDSSYGNAGYADDVEMASSSAVMQGDNILVAGHINEDFALARYAADGRLDSTFGVNGKVITDFYGYNDEANSIALQGDKIVAAGSSIGNFALARYTSNGFLDSSFGVNGLVTTGFDSFYSYANASAIAMQGNKIIAAGYAGFHTNNAHSDFALARYTADGILDSSFGVNGEVITYFNHITNAATSIMLQGTKIVVAGSTNDEGIDYGDPVSDFAIVRYTADGTLDSSFGVNGKAITDFNNLDDEANSIALQGNKFIAAGITGKYRYGGNYNFALARYTADGTLDSSFGVNGEVITYLSGSSSIQDIALYQNRLYAVGTLTIAPDAIFGVVAAYQLETPEPSISIADVTAQESKKQAVVTVSLSAPATQPVRVSYTTRDITARDTQDYLGVKDTLLFNPGITTAKIIITIIDDSVQENNEQFDVFLTNPLGAIIQDSIAVFTIIDDDTLHASQDSLFHIYVSPNPSNGVFAVQVQGSDFNRPVSVRVFDMSGRLIEKRMNVTIGQSLRLGDLYMAGIYIIEARQGSRRTQTKVVKTSK